MQSLTYCDTMINKIIYYKVYLFPLTLFLLLGFQFVAKSQEVNITFGETEIGLQETFTITATINNSQLTGINGFPEIVGLTKTGTSSSQSTSIIDGKRSFSQSITQNYRANKVGTYTVKPFTITINGKAISVQGTTVKVTPQTSRRQNDPFADFFGMRDDEPTEFINVKEDAFFAVTTSKPQVYVGEGFNLSVAMYIAEENRALLEFHEIGEQLGMILKKIKPANCWEENFGIEEIIPESVTIGRKSYRQYKIYQANFYPINTGEVIIPSVDFKMIKFKVAVNQSFFGTNHVRDFITFKSKEKVVKVVDLPPHPLKGNVAIGNYKLQDDLSLPSVKTGQTFNYKFQVVGEGNIAQLTNLPTVKKNGVFSFYKPNEKIQINRSANTVYGSKQFNYLLSANEAGNYRMGDIFEWVFFNTNTNKYDTLHSRLSLQVTGEKIVSKIDSTGLGDFYSLIKEADNDIKSWEQNIPLKIMINFVFLATLSILGYQIVKKHKKKN
jgi:hypothetical protein